MTSAYPLTKANRIKLARAFKHVPRVDLSIECAIEGQIGKTYVDDLHKPTVFKIEVGPFFYLAGDASGTSAQTLLENILPYTLFMPSGPGWLEAAKRMYAEQLASMERFSFSSAQISAEHLEDLSQRTAFDEAARRMDLPFAKRFWGQSHFVDLSAYDSPEDFIERGVGFTMHKGSKLVGAAYASLVCSRGIEVSLYVKEDYRRQGIATLLSCGLLEWCLEHNAEPHWDAANPESCRLAEKLGYRQTGSYQAYYLT